MPGDAPRAELLASAHGDDCLDGGAGGDLLIGHDGKDTLRGDEGSDGLLGNAPVDETQGSFDAADLLNGGAGNDGLTGGGANGVPLNGSSLWWDGARHISQLATLRLSERALPANDKRWRKTA